MICKGCGGLLGRDCFNPQECEWIAEQEQKRFSPETEQAIYFFNNFEKHIKDAYDQGDVDGYCERAGSKKERDFKNAQDYYDKTFKK